MTGRMLLVAALLLGVPTLSPQATAQSAGVAEGEVVKVDPSSGRIIIRHGPIAGMTMIGPAATHEFKVAEPIMLNTLRPGARIKFTAARVNGELTLTRVYP